MDAAGSRIRHDHFSSTGWFCGLDQADLVAHCPPDLGYGPPVLGLHLYSWALVVFGCLIASSAIGLCGLQNEQVSLPRLPVYLLCSLTLVIGLTVAFATFLMQGFNALLPPDPTRYELWHTFFR